MLAKSDTPVLFGAVLRSIRIERGLSQEALALEAGLQRNYISLMERGLNQPTITTIFRLALALGVRPSVLVERVEVESLRKGGADFRVDGVN
jgi:transcriptional regulator with XRE-family HTH domain